MTNEQEVLEFADECGFALIRSDRGIDGGNFVESIVCNPKKLVKFAQAIRDQEAAKIARLRELLARFEYNEYGPKRFPTEEEIESALSAMQPTVDAFVARIKAEAKIEELKEVIDAVCQLANDSTYHVATCVYREVEERMCARLAELRNAKEV